MKLPKPTRFEWDKGNEKKNWEKHEVHAKEAEEVFVNRPRRIWRDKKHSQKENRLTILGITNTERFLYVVFTVRNGNIRIISARDQSKKERELYGKKTK